MSCDVVSVKMSEKLRCYVAQQLPRTLLRQVGRRSCASGAARASASTASTDTSSSGPRTCWRFRKCALLLALVTSLILLLLATSLVLRGVGTHARSNRRTTGVPTARVAGAQVDPDKAFAVQMTLEESVLQEPVAYIQCALLYTSSNGERRIR